VQEAGNGVTDDNHVERCRYDEPVFNDRIDRDGFGNGAVN